MAPPKRNKPLATLATLAVALASASFLALGDPAPAAEASCPSHDLSFVQETTMSTIPSVGKLFTDAFHWLTEPRQDWGSLSELDARTLADIGVSASEISSIDAEWMGRSSVTRRRIVVGLHHA